MRINVRRPVRTALATAVGAAAVAAGAVGVTAASAQSTKAHAAAASPIQLLSGTGPQSLDPGLDYTTQGAEINWEVYTGLTTYKHAAGIASTELQPGLTTALPVISNGGKTYTFTLRKGLKYSNGDPVKASDFAYSVERSLTIPWGGASTFVTPYVVGASAYASHKAKSISGITTSNTTGKIVIHLTKPYGPFANVLAFSAFGLVDPKTAPEPFKVQAGDPPAGDGPYMVTNISIGKSFNIVPEPELGGDRGHPEGHPVVHGADRFERQRQRAVSSEEQQRDLRLGRHDPAVRSLSGKGHRARQARQPRRFGVLLLPELQQASVQQPARSRGGCDRSQPAWVLAPRLGHPGTGLLLPSPGHRGSWSWQVPVRHQWQRGQGQEARTGVGSGQRADRHLCGAARSAPAWCVAYEQELKTIGFKNVTLKQVADDELLHHHW